MRAALLVPLVTGWALLVSVLGGCGRLEFDERTDAFPSTGTFGAQQFGIQRGQQNPDAMRAARWELTTDADVTSITLSLVGDTSTNVQPMVGVIYSDASGQPDALLARSEEIIISGTMPMQWVDFPLAVPVHLAPGFYWIGDHTGNPDCTFFTFDPIVGTGRRPDDLYADGTAAIAAPGPYTDVQYSFYATYLRAP